MASSANHELSSGGGFCSASGNKVSPSADAPKEGERLLDEIPTPGDANEQQKIKGEALRSVRRCYPIRCSPPQRGGFQTASGKGVAVSSAALKKAKMLLIGCDEVEDTIFVKPTHSKMPVPGPTPRNSGFLAASGKQVAFSSEALQKAKALFGDIGFDAEIPAVPDTRDSNKTRDEADVPEKIHCGFSTAGGAKVHVSKKNLLEAKNLLAGFDDGSISAEAMQEADAFFKDCVTMDGNDGMSVEQKKGLAPGCGSGSEKKQPFRASGKQVAFSSEALQKAKALFGDIGFDEEIPAVADTGDGNKTRGEADVPEKRHCGFTTAGGAKVHVVQSLSSSQETEHENESPQSRSVPGCILVKDHTHADAFRVKEGHVSPALLGNLPGGLVEDVSGVSGYKIQQTSSREGSTVKRPQVSSPLNFQSLNLSGCTETQQKLFAQEALDCTTAFNGGPVGCVDIVVLRSYPLQWMERKPGGGVVFRSVRAEEKEERRYSGLKQKAMEILSAKIQDAFEKEDKDDNKPQRRRRTISRQDIAGLQGGEELYEAVGDDPAYLEAHLSEQQLETLGTYRRSLMEKRQAELQDRYRRALLGNGYQHVFNRGSLPVPWIFKNQSFSHCFSPAFYVADGELNFVKVRCFSSFAQSGLEELVKPRVLLALSNLQLRGQSTSPTPVVYAGDLTLFSTNPKEAHLQESLSQNKNLVQGTPQQLVRSLGSFTPVGRKPPAANCSTEKDPSSVKRRRAQDYLSRIPSPPPLLHLGSESSPCVNKTFNPPRRSGTPSTLNTAPIPARKPGNPPVEDEWVNDEELAMIDTQALHVGDSLQEHKTMSHYRGSFATSRVKKTFGRRRIDNGQMSPADMYMTNHSRSPERVSDRSVRERALKQVGLTSKTFIGPAFAPPKPQKVKPDMVKPGTVKSGTVKTGTVKSGTVKSGAVKSGTVKSGMVKSDIEDTLSEFYKEIEKIDAPDGAQPPESIKTSTSRQTRNNVSGHPSQGFYGDSPYHFDRDERVCGFDAHSDNVNVGWPRVREEESSHFAEDYDRSKRYDAENEPWDHDYRPPANANAFQTSLDLILMRGLPGSGKSTLARERLSAHPNGLILSTDDYFGYRDGYRYDPDNLGAAHEWNLNRARDAMQAGRSPIIIDNTNVQAWEMKPYVKMAMEKGYKVDFCEPETSWKCDPYELERRNKHSVPQEKIAQMMARFSFPISVDIVMRSQEPAHVSERPGPEQPVPPMMREIPNE
ncbi:NEDD4-binding protein 2-like 2 [Liparis tanakae]|uniref:NEDD4-binding protein 2-like 2 n=1 Tax=Liparis tanakae TaxID=230148 RepID=A0A4Z2J8P5_9TELE|nr:NEDD4-binding protein 2-like 2 [Liparis tanakae]